MTDRKYAWHPDVPDHRDHFYEAMTFALPLKVDRLGMGNRIEDQGNLGSCTGNSTTSAIEIVTKVPYELSRLMAYYEGRKIEHQINQDAGCQIRDVIKGVQTVGVCKESLYPYDITKFKHAPSKAAKTDALTLISKIESYKRLRSLNEMKDVLAQGLAVVFGFAVPAYMQSAEVHKSGWLRLPADTDRMVGGHAVAAVGYDDTASIPFIWVRNSWGASWGIDGYFQMDQQWFTDPRRLVDDMWVMFPSA